MSSKNTKKCSSTNPVAPFNWRCSYPRSIFSLRCKTNKVLPSPAPSSSRSHVTLTPSRAASRVAPSTSDPSPRKRLRDLERDIDRLKARIRQENHRHTKRCLVGEEKEGKGPIDVRFPDGSFLHEMTKIGKPWERLCMHVSVPTLAEDATTADVVLERFTKMKIGDLCRCLMSLMPMIDISGLKLMRRASKPYHPNDETQFLTESILFASVKKLEQLVLEGLKIQMRGTRKSESHTGEASGAGTDLDATTVQSTDRSDWVVLVTLIQMRDPKDDFGPVGELMIGLVEAQLGANGVLHFSVEGVHVAGLNLARNKISGRDFMWSISMNGCGGSDGSAIITRNPDHLFPPPTSGKD